MDGMMVAGNSVKSELPGLSTPWRVAQESGPI
jgi:hypothetical protein